MLCRLPFGMRCIYSTQFGLQGKPCFNRVKTLAALRRSIMKFTFLIQRILQFRPMCPTGGFRR